MATIIDEIPLRLQIDEIVRELALREKVYSSWIERGKMRQDVADKHMARMRAVLVTLMRLEGHKRDVNVDRMPES
jgi:hypothetical protein